MDISDWRNKIDTIDSKLIHLLNERAGYAVEIGKIKRDRSLPVFDPKRETEVLELLSQRNQGPLPQASILRIFQTIMEETRKTESGHAGASL